MSVYRHALVCVILVAISYLTQAVVYPHYPRKSSDTERDFQGDTSEHRQKRSALALGKSVLRLILGNARRVYSNGYDNVFVKSGGFQRAIDDFDRFDSRIKKINKTDKSRKVGNIVLTLRYDTKTLTLTEMPLRSHTNINPPLENIIYYTD